MPSNKVPQALPERLVVAISSRALFDLDASHRVFEEDGVEGYHRYQIEHEDDILEPGVAFEMTRKLLHINSLVDDGPLVEIILLSRNTADTGLRIFNSIQHYGLDIARAAFSGGRNPYTYANAYGAHLFLSSNTGDVREALDAGMAAAAILPGRVVKKAERNALHIAFDGDAVLFSDEAERVYKSSGLAEFNASEKKSAHEPLGQGPFRAFLGALHALQSRFTPEESPIRTALVTARSAPAHERVIRTLRDWDIRIDEALFLGGKAKAPFLEAFGADIFFDDHSSHCEEARLHVATGHVPHGVANEG